jgi:DNA polymerase III delta subunit
MPFYKFGNIIFLKKIETKYLVEFINKRFADTKKQIDVEASELIVNMTDNHPYYVQQLAQLSWLRTKDVCTVDTVKAAHSTLVEQLSLLFVTITEGLTSQNLCYLKALLAGEKSISSTAVMTKYHISSATSVTRSKDALVKNDILDKTGDDISFQDPIYEYWLKHCYFEM